MRPEPDARFGGERVLHVCDVQFFDARGNGPDAVPIGVEWMDAIREGDREISPRSIWVVAGPDPFGGPTVSRPGGYRLFDADARSLRDALTAWLDEAAIVAAVR